MSIQALKQLRAGAWIPTPHGDKFSLHFDDTLYLQLVAKYITDDVAGFSCETVHAGGFTDAMNEVQPDLYADGYEAGYNSAVEQIVEHLRKQYGFD